MPNEFENQLCFKNWAHTQRIPFLIYADFECLLEQVPAAEAVVGRNGNTSREREHLPIAVGLKLVSSRPAFQMPYEVIVQERPDDPEPVAEKFLRRLLQLEEILLEQLCASDLLSMSESETAMHDAADYCYLCKQRFDQAIAAVDQTWQKVRDHDHYTGQYRGAAHSYCNLQLRRQIKIPVFLHNFRGYDSHLIVAAMGKVKDQAHPIRVIGQGLERYLQLCWGKHIVFRDSYQFLEGALATLVESLRSAEGGVRNFKQLAAGFGYAAEPAPQFERLLRKGVFPYDWFDEWSKLGQSTLPTKEEFYNLLTQSTINDAEYVFAETMWAEYKCASFRDYLELYLKMDVLLLADVFEAFREFVLRYYELDPAHYVSSPALSWDALFKYTGATIELITDNEMFRMIDSGIRGGIVTVVKRFAQANSPDMGAANYKPDQPTTHLLYIDANNLYGFAMCQPMPISGFRWLEQEEIVDLETKLQNGEYKPEKGTGFIFEADLEYPAELHRRHSDYPLAPERVCVAREEQSLLQHEIRDAFGVHITSWKKLVTTLYDKYRYVVHHRNLLFYLEKGMRLKRLWRGIQFREEDWMRPYIEMNTQLRQQSTSNFERDHFKKMVNSVYGKTCENQKKRSDIKLTTTRQQHLKLASKPHCRNQRIFNEGLAVVDMEKTTILINRPFYVGFTVLELSKLHIYETHYNHFMSLYGHSCRLVYSDTDSLIYQIRTEDVNRDCFEFRGELFDMSTFPVNHPFFDGSFKDVPGKFKIETKGKIFAEIVALSPKNYSYRLLDPEKLNWSDSRRTKGIQRSVRDNRLSHADFVRQIFEPGPYSISNIVTAAEHPEQQNRLLVRRIGSERHTIYQYSTSRRGLSCFDDKRYLSANNITTIPYGHFGLTASLLGETWVPDLNSKVKSDFLFPLHNDVYSSCSRLNETGRLKRRAAAILIRLENHRGKRAKIEAQMPKANSGIDECLAKELESARLTHVQANYLKRNYVWNYAEKLALITNTPSSHEIASEMMDLIRDAGEAEDSRKWRRRNNPHSALGQQKARDLAGGYFVCPHMPNTVEEARRIKENNMRRAASASAKAAQRATDMAGDEAGSFMNLLPPALKRRRRARLGLPCLLSPTSSEERGISFVIQSIVEPEFDLNATVGNT